MAATLSRTFCELVEGEEDKLTTFSTCTIALGCNESNIIFQQHLATNPGRARAAGASRASARHTHAQFYHVR